MSIYVHLCNRLLEDLEHHAEGRNGVIRLKTKIEEEQSIVNLDQFLPSPFLKKSLGAMRLVIEQRTVHKHTILIFARLMFRSDKSYDIFTKDPDSIRSTYHVADAELDVYGKDPPPSRVLRLSDAESHFLWTPGAEQYDEMVLETADWVDRIKRPAYVPWHSAIYNLAVRASDRSVDENATVADGGDIRVIYRRIDASKRLVLIAPILKHDNEQEGQIISRFRHLLAAEYQPDEETLLRSARRAYPLLVLADVTTWLGTQKSAMANLALSPEEGRVLQTVFGQSIQDARVSNVGFPVFINGRPGSGKSTILQYLFARALHGYHKLPKDNRPANSPLYITYSPPLLETAKSAARSILTCDAIHGSALDSVSATDVGAEIVSDSCFQNFKDFLLSLIPPEKKQDFDQKSYVTYPRFRRLWQQHLGAHPRAEVRRLGAELSWHVIRTYIKGMRDEDGNYFSVEDYADHPINRKSVTDASFKLVYDDVWESWYKTEAGWDDQDLVRAVLDAGTDKLPQYPAVFCDEAQDFTRIELELLLNLSLYTRRDVPKEQLHLVPFAFAGDPFQTLNPTGFDWEAVRAMFHEHIVRSLDREGNGRLSLNFQELSYNYRSNDQIVKICNLIQLLRGVAFESRSLQPQQAWFDETAVAPSVFSVESPAVEERLRTDVEAVIIVPAHENGEEEFVDADALLKEFCRDSSGLTRTVLSPMRAKGLEFSRVILYKFGDMALSEAPELLDVLATWKPLSGARDRHLRAEYFVNRLYVAASRARVNMTIVDTASAIERFWKPLGMNASPEQMIAAYGTVDKASATAWSAEAVGKLYDGDVQQWFSSGDDALEIAEKFLIQGRVERDLFLLGRARAIFSQRGRNGSSRLCEALISEFEFRWAQAGEAYADLMMYEEAVDCLWKAKSFRRIVALAEKVPAQSRSRLKFEASHFMAGDRGFDESKQLLTTLLRSLGSTDSAVALGGDDVLAGCVDALVDVLGRHAEADASSGADRQQQWALLWQGLEGISKCGLVNLERLAAATVAARAARYDRVVELWPRLGLGKQMPIWVKDAHAKALPFPGRLRFLGELERWGEIAEQWLMHQGSHLSADDARLVVIALLQESRLHAAMDLVRSASVSDTDLVERLFAAARKAHEPAVERFAGELLLKQYVNDRDWKRAIGTVTPGRPPLEASVRLQLVRSLVQWLAISDGLVSSSADDQRIVSDFLRAEVVAEQSLRRMLSAEEVGAAIERAGRHVDALSFYESVLRGDWGTDEDLRRFARGRWFSAKDKLARTAGKTAQQRHQQELNDAAVRLGLTQEHIGAELARLPRFPRPGHREESFIGPGPTVAAKQPLPAAKPERSVGDEVFELIVGTTTLTGRCFATKKRINVTGDGLVCKIKLDGGVVECESEELGVCRVDAVDGWTEWEIDPWHLRIRARLGTDGIMEVAFFAGDTQLRTVRVQ